MRPYPFLGEQGPLDSLSPVLHCTACTLGNWGPWLEPLKRRKRLMVPGRWGPLPEGNLGGGVEEGTCHSWGASWLLPPGAVPPPQPSPGGFQREQGGKPYAPNF